MIPVSVRAEVERGAARQPGRGDDGPAAGVVPGAARAARPRAPGAERPQAGRAGRGRPGAHRPDRLRAADDHGPGGAPDVAPALLQPRGDERARARSSRSTWRAGACSTRSRWSRWRPARALGVALLSYDGKINFGLVGRLRHALGPRRARGRRARLARRAGGHGGRAAHRATAAATWRHEGQGRRQRPLAGLEVRVQRLEQSTRTVSDAAQAVGCQEAEIAKSIVFVADGDPVVCVASGRHRIDAGQAGGRARRGRGAPGGARTRCAPPPASRSAASRRSATTCPSSSTRSSSSTSASGPPPGDPHSLFAVDPRVLARCTHARVIAVGEDGDL